MASNLNKRIVISGTYGTGKSTITNELARVTGIPKAVARGMRDILPETFPGKKLEECGESELLQLGIIRYGERVALERAVMSGFISDGSALHEWAYGYGRQVEGAMGKGTELISKEYEFGMKTFGEIVKRHAKQNYTDIIHLPVEFALPKDGHRPVSEDFRKKADEILLGAWRELGFNPVIIGGSVQERLDRIVNALDLDASSTTYGGKKQGEVVYFDKIEDILGDPTKRFFSNGYRNTRHNIHNVEINLAEKEITAKVDLTYAGGDWSIKKDKVCTAHFSSVDSILVAGQLAQAYMYTLDGISREESSNMWLRDLQIKTGNRPIENCEGIEVRFKIDSKYLEKCGKKWHLANAAGEIGNSGFKIDARVGYELPRKL